MCPYDLGQLLLFLTALFSVGRVSRFKPRQFSAKGIHFPLQDFLLRLDKVFDGKRLFQFFNGITTIPLFYKYFGEEVKK